MFIVLIDFCTHPTTNATLHAQMLDNFVGIIFQEIPFRRKGPKIMFDDAKVLWEHPRDAQNM